MKKIEFNPADSIEQCYAKIKSEAIRKGGIVCGEFNEVLMRSDESLNDFYKKYYQSEDQMEETKDEMQTIGFALPPIPKGKKAIWVGDTLKLVDAPEEVIDNRPITEKVKTFEDACQLLGESHPYVIAYNAFEKDVLACVGAEDIADVSSYLKLRIIATALNEGWKPEFTEKEYRWYPWFYLYTQDEIDQMTEERKKELSLLLWGGSAHSGSYCGLGFVYSWSAFSSSLAVCGSRLAVKSEELAIYFGRQFINIWADYCFKPGCHVE